MTLSPDPSVRPEQRPEQREVTPEERRRAGRMFWLILLLFPMVVGMMVAYLSVKGRQVRDYGQAILQQAEQATPALTTAADCTRFGTGRALPASVKTCVVKLDMVKPDGAGLVVVMDMENGQQYQIHSK